MQPIEPMLYESTGLLEYDYQSKSFNKLLVTEFLMNFSARSYMGSSQGTRSMTYANVPYPVSFFTIYCDIIIPLR